MELTKFELEFIKGMTNNDYSNLYEGYKHRKEFSKEWLFAVVDECSFNEKQSTGVISSLVKKDFIRTMKDEGNFLVGFTKKGFDWCTENNVKGDN